MSLCVFGCLLLLRCALLFVVVGVRCLSVLLFVVVRCCLLLFVVACCCLLLLVVVRRWSLLFVCRLVLVVVCGALLLLVVAVFVVAFGLPVLCVVWRCRLSLLVVTCCRCSWSFVVVVYCLLFVVCCGASSLIVV